MRSTWKFSSLAVISESPSIWSLVLLLYTRSIGVNPNYPTRSFFTSLSREPSFVEDIFSFVYSVCAFSVRSTWKFSFGRLATHKARFINEYWCGEWTIHFYHSAPPFWGSVVVDPNCPAWGFLPGYQQNYASIFHLVRSSFVIRLCWFFTSFIYLFPVIYYSNQGSSIYRWHSTEYGR